MVITLFVARQEFASTHTELSRLPRVTNLSCILIIREQFLVIQFHKIYTNVYNNHLGYTSWKIIQTFRLYLENENIGYGRFGKNNGKFQFFM